MRAKKAVISPGRALAGRPIPGKSPPGLPERALRIALYTCAFTCNLLKDSLYQACELGLEYDHEPDEHHHKFSPISGNRMDTGRNHSLLHAPWSFYLLNKEIRQP